MMPQKIQPSTNRWFSRDFYYVLFGKLHNFSKDVFLFEGFMFEAGS